MAANAQADLRLCYSHAKKSVLGMRLIYEPVHYNTNMMKCFKAKKKACQTDLGIFLAKAVKTISKG